MSASYEENVEFPAPHHDVFVAAVTAVGRSPKMAIRAAEESVGLIVAVKAMSFRSWGEVILVKLREVSQQRTTAWVWSESFQLYDPWRVNRSNVTSVLDGVRHELGSRGDPIGASSFGDPARDHPDGTD